MIYTIDEDIVYNSDDCTLKHLPTNEAIKLSITSGRLLEKFLHSNGAVLTRETLLTEVWDLYGLNGSHNNLNQYVSILRRAFSDWGADGLIITIPKIGFRLNPDILVVRTESHAGLITEKRDDNDTTHTQSGSGLKSGRVGRWTVISFLLVSITLLPAILIYIFRNDIASDDVPLAETKSPEGCEIVYLKKVGENRRIFLLKEVNGIMKENGMRCTTGTRIYFVNYTSFSIQNLGRSLISYCQLNDERIVISCINTYYKDRRVL